MAAGPNRARVAYEAVGCFDLARAGAMKQAIDALARELGGADTKAACAEARGPGPGGFALNYAQDRLERAPFVDLHRRGRASRRCDAPAGEGPRGRAAGAGRRRRVRSRLVGGTALPRFVPGRSGIYVTLPDGDAPAGPRGSTMWARCRWYSPGPVPGVYGKLAWCKDGAEPGNGVVENCSSCSTAGSTPGKGRGQQRLRALRRAGPTGRSRQRID
jgi:hypothetical protein